MAEEEAPRQEPMATPQGRRVSGLSPSMVAIMDSQVEDMRKSLMRFKVLAVPPPDVGNAPPPAQAVVPPHADILVFGPSGSGKSSLIRTFYMALHKTRQLPPDFAERIIVKDTTMNEGTLKYVSAVVKPARVDHRGCTVSSAILCHDTRGHIWMDEREQRQLSIIMDGNVQDDRVVEQRNYRYARLLWEFWRRDVDLFPPEILVRRGGLQTKPHAILFVFDGSMSQIPDGEEETRFYKDIISMARAKGYLNPQIVLTCIDKVEEQLTKNSAGATAADRELKLRQVLDQKIVNVVLKLEVPRTSVHFIENYHTGFDADSEGRNVAVDFHALKILSQCCSHADAFVAQNLGTAPARSSCTLQ